MPRKNNKVPDAKNNTDKLKSKAKKSNYHQWVMLIVVVTFILCALFSVLSEKMVNSVNVMVAIIALMMFILIGIIFDIIGIAVASASEVPFHSMAARRVKGAKEAIFLLKHAEKVSNFCNDVVGDIAGIISGATGAAIAANIILTIGGAESIFITIAVTALISSLTVGGKALGKGVAINRSNDIVYVVAKLISVFDFDSKRR